MSRWQEQEQQQQQQQWPQHGHKRQHDRRGWQAWSESGAWRSRHWHRDGHIWDRDNQGDWHDWAKRDTWKSSMWQRYQGRSRDWTKGDAWESSKLGRYESERNSYREEVLSAVKKYWLALQDAAEDCRSDREIVLAAVQQDWVALRLAAKDCRSDREIVLAAVQQSGLALNHAAEDCRSDREIMLAAVQQNSRNLKCVAEELLEDGSFAPEARRNFHILRVALLSGRRCVLACAHYDGWHGTAECTEDVLEECAYRLGLRISPTTTLIHGLDVVPDSTRVSAWPGMRPCGEVNEFQLIA